MKTQSGGFNVKSSVLVKIGSVVFLLFLLAVTVSPPPVLAEATTGVSWDDDGALLYESTGVRSSNYYPFAGGSSCCGCATRHYGTLPGDFPTHSASAVTFFLTASRSNSYYTSIVNGPNALRLVFTEPGENGKQYSSTATSIKVTDGITLPIDTPWYITFEFATPITFSPGWGWELLDGDNNIYSAVWLHLSDVDHQGLPGTAETSDCQYEEWRSAWYSVKFGTVDGSTGAQHILNLNPTDAWLKPVNYPATDPLLTINGTLTDLSGTPVSQARIDIEDPMKYFSTWATTDANGAFSYTTYTNVQGVYLLSFVYSEDIKARNTVLVDVGHIKSGGRVSLFGDIKIRNDDDVPLYLIATYFGPTNEQEAEKGTTSELSVQWPLPIQPGQEWVILDIDDLDISTVDSTPQQGEDDPDIISIGAEVCPVMVGVGQVCVDSGGTISAVAGTGVQGGVYAGQDGFGVTIGVGGNLPYIVEGGAALAIGTDGLHIVGSGGPGVAHGTVSIDLIALAKKQSQMRVESPVEPYLVDPEGRAIGIDPETGEMVNQIPRATYSGPASEPQIIRIPADSLVAGEYEIQLVGIDKGKYRVQTEVYEGQLIDGVIDNALLDGVAVSGTVNDGDIVTAIVEYDETTGTMTVISHSGGGGGMPAWVWVIIVLAVLVVVGRIIMRRKKAQLAD
jgi:hypothetical protein